MLSFKSMQGSVIVIKDIQINIRLVLISLFVFEHSMAEFLDRSIT